MKSLRKLLRSKVAVIPTALVVVGLVMVGCESKSTDQSAQPTQSTGQSPSITVAAPSPDITSQTNNPPTVGVTGTINATVLDSFTRGPINGALVTINVGGRNISATSAGGGLASLAGIPLDESQTTTQSQPIQITITGATGYPSPSFWATTLQRNASDTVNANIASEIIIELHRTDGVVSGALLDPVNGTILTGVNITLTPNPLNIEISGGAFLRVDQPFGGLVTISTGTGFAFFNVPSDHDYVLDISDPQGRIRDLRVGSPFTSTAPNVSPGSLGSGIEVPPTGTVNLDVGATLGTGVPVLVGGLSANLVSAPQQGRPGADAVTPFVTTVAIGGITVSQGQDIPSSVVTALASTAPTAFNANIKISFNEMMDPAAGLTGIQLLDLGPKGTAALTGTRVLAAVVFDSTGGVPNRDLLIKPATTLVAGRRYVVTGLGGLKDPAGNRYGGNQAAPPATGACVLIGGVVGAPGAGYPQCDRTGVPDYMTGGMADLNGNGLVGDVPAERGVFFFTTNNTLGIVGSSATVLALSGAPTVTGKRNNLSRLARAAGSTAGLGSRSAASFNIDWTKVAPAGANAYNVCVVVDSTSAGGRAEDCVVLPSTPGVVPAVPSFSFGGPPSVPFTTGTPATAFRFTMDDLQAALVAVGRSLPLITSEAGLRGLPNTILDNNQRIRVRVSVLNKDGVEGPQSADATDATTSSADLGDNTGPSLNEDANFDATEASGEDLDGDPVGAAVIFSDLAVRNYFAPGVLPPPALSGSLLAFPASVTLPKTPLSLAVYDVLQSAFPATSPSTQFLGRVPFNNAAGARLDTTATLRVTFIEDILPTSASTTTISISDGTTPIGGAATATPEANVTSAAVVDADRDATTGTNGNVVNVGVDNVLALNTGDKLNVNVTDEAGNVFNQSLTLLDTIRPFAVSVVASDNGCNTDTVTIAASESLNAASVTDARTVFIAGGVAVTGASKAVLPGSVALQNQVQFSGPNTITLFFPDGTLKGLTAASTFFTTGTGGFGGVTDLAENRNLFLNDGTAIAPIAGLALPPTTGFTVGDAIPPRLTVTPAGFANPASSWKVGAGTPPAAQPVTLSVVVEFTEPVDPTTATNPTNYVFASVDADAYTVTTAFPGPIACVPAVAGGICSATVVFTLNSTVNGATAGDTLTVSNVMDLSGNVIALQKVLTLPAAGPTYTLAACPFP